jgi:hypothetical protein
MAAGSFVFAPRRTPFTQEGAQALLVWTTRCWFAVMLAGQLMFAAYITMLYGVAAVRGDLAAWNSVMPRAYVAGATAGNVATALHLAGAAFIMLSGALQLLPGLRARAPSVHRWNGRLYLVAAIGASLTGVYLVWWRGTVGDVVQHLGTTFNGGLILLCAAMALWRIRSGDVAAHRRWALRLFLTVSGVLFFRIGLMFWLALHGRPVGFDPGTFTGPVLSFLAFAQTVLPLALLELYLRCARAGAAARLVMAAVLAGLTLALVIGIAVATLAMWLPSM